MNSDDKLTYAAYSHFAEDVQAEIRREAFGEDIGQFSWITAAEFREFLTGLHLGPDSVLLDVACGSGGPARYAAETLGCKVVGLDIKETALAVAAEAARKAGLEDRVRFLRADASERLPFEDCSFDGIVSIDAMNHVYKRQEMFGEWMRVLRPGARFLYTDAVVVGGMLLRDEILARSSGMGQFIFTPAGLHEKLIESAGFEDIVVKDVTSTIEQTARRWHDARAARRQALIGIEGSEDFESMQLMLLTASSLAGERRLLRQAFSGRKPQSD